MNNTEQINTSSYVHPEAKIGKNVIIHPFVKIEKGVVVGDNCEIHSFVSLLEGTHLGTDNQIFEGCVIGAAPQEHVHKKEYTEVYIGNNNVIRENVVINRGLSLEHPTTIGDHNFVMEGVHISHDVEIGSRCVFGYSTKIASFCNIADGVFIGMLCGINKKCRIGRLSFISAHTIISKHVPPFVRIGGLGGEWQGVNTTILKEHDFSEKSIREILFAYRLIYSQFSLDYIKFKLDGQLPESEVTQEIVQFARNCVDKGFAGKEDVNEKKES